MDLSTLKTEARNPLTENIDQVSTLEMLRIINSEDQKVALAVEKELPNIAKAVDLIGACLQDGGRLIYMGWGTSGRLGILDAVECPPTYSTAPEQVVGLIAGGYNAIFKAVEGAEDNLQLGEEDLKNLNLAPVDVVVGLAASGRTPYVLGGMAYARSIGAKVVGVSCCPDSEIARSADIAITPTPGPEVVTGSTRMKSGTAQKMVCNMLSTGAMIRLGKVYGNLMVDVKPSNEKLIQRCKHIVCEATGVTIQEAEATLEQCNYQPKVAIVMIRRGVSAEEAKQLLANAGGRIANVLER